MEKKFARRVMLFGCLILFLILGLRSIRTIPVGHTGIVTTFGKMEDRLLYPGVNFVLPWQSVTSVDNRTQKQSLETEAFSSDIQQVQILATINYRIEPNKEQALLANIGRDFVETIMIPRALESTKTIFSQYPAEQLVENRAILSAAVAELLTSNLAPYGITIDGFAIENLDFSDAFTNAVEAKQVATQKKLEAETKQAQLTLEAEAEAKRKLIAAEAEAQAKIIAAQAEAEANAALAKSVTPELIELKEAEARLMHGWVTVQGGTTTTATIAGTSD